MTIATRTRGAAPFWGFAVFGAFWGTWGANLPRFREAADISNAEMGVALLFVGAGALPAMMLVGRALDRWGLGLTGPILVALGVAGCLVPLSAGGGFVPLCAGMAVVGATSGAADVAMNSLAGRAEREGGRPIITPAHATFSAVVVLGTLGAGALSAGGAPLVVSSALVALGAGAACIAIVRAVPRQGTRQDLASPVGAASALVSPAIGIPTALVIAIGALGALAFAGENAQQSWSAVFLEDELSAPLGVSAVGPAVFAGVVALTRFSISRVPSRHARAVILLGATTATAGALLLAAAPTRVVALIGLGLTAAGTGVLFPTLLGIVSRAVPEHRRGRTTSLVTTIAYTGFLAGPAYVGLVADAAGLRGAMVAVALLTAVLALLTPVILRPER
jgi:predicted MFS family arabinose efflux permease